MGLRNLTFPTVEVQTSGGALAVRGLSLDHIMGLFYRHREDVTMLYNSLVVKAKAGMQVTEDDVTVIAIKLVNGAPTVVAEIIALASGSDPSMGGFAEDVEIARSLSMAEQLDALEKIASQTVTSDMPPGKMLALVFQTMQAGTSAMGGLPGLRG